MRRKTLITLVMITGILCWVIIQCLIFFIPVLVEKAIKSTEHIVFVQNTNLESMPGVQILDANNSSFIILRNEPNRIDVKWKDTNIFIKEPKSRLQKLDSPIVQVMAEFNNKQYPVIIDSGFNMYLMVDDIVVIENELKIFPVKTNEPAFAGLCSVENIKIGDMTITNPQCLYMLGHYEKRILGQTKWKQSKIIFGLEMMRQFKYILIDNISSQVEFSMESYESDPNETWQHYQMSLEKVNNNMRAMIEIPIAGEKTKIMFDTGAASFLSMSQNKWVEFSKKLKVIGETNGHAQMINGFEDIKDITIKKILLGEKDITGKHIEVYNNDIIQGPDFFMLGMDCFKDTVIVLDFEHNLFWVRQTTDLAANKKDNI